jgi:putative nucleotidyltransferase with HDIG domain
MTRYLNLTGRTFLLLSLSIGLLLAVARATGVLCTSPLQAVAAGLILSVGLARVLSHMRAATWRDLKLAVLESERSGTFTPNFPENSPLAEVNRLAAALNGAARSIENSQADLDAAYLQFVETMAQALDARDPYTAGHSLRVAAYSHSLARAIGLSEQDADTIRIAAQLHDIGKIGIPDVVLQKPGLLTPEEYGLIKLHPQIGRKILEKVGRFERLLAVVELHHENHDGSGYPYGLSGSKIPIAARIVHVADSFDAMTTTRSYRSALPMRSAVHEIERNAGGMFDPVVAKAFLKLIAAGQIEIGSLEVSEQVAVREHLAV